MSASLERLRASRERLEYTIHAAIEILQRENEFPAGMDLYMARDRSGRFVFLDALAAAVTGDAAVVMAEEIEAGFEDTAAAVHRA
jgi:hypothetical protein